MIPRIKTMEEALRAATDQNNICLFNQDGRRCYSGKEYRKGVKRQAERAAQIEAFLMRARVKKMADDRPGVMVNLDEWVSSRVPA